MKFFKSIFILSVFISMGFTLQAQKFGYVDSNGILEQMPEVKAMRSNLKVLQDQLNKQGQKLVTEYQAQEASAIEKKKAGNLSPQEEETIIQNLAKKQEEFLKFQQEMQSKILKKEQELLEPILTKVRKAISDVAAENGYQFIFDAGVLLYASDVTDVSAKVKAKLGIK